jgi:galactofuranose transport system substrate-binding protein
VQAMDSLMNIRVLQSSILAPLALLALLAGCSDRSDDGGSSGGSSVVLGVSQVAGGANWDTASHESIRDAARVAGIELRVEDSKRSQEKQRAALRAFVEQGVDVIAFSPVVETGWEIVLGEIRSAGIPVVLMDRAIEISDDTLYSSVVGSDFVEEGRRAARWLLEHTRDIPGQIDIVELQGTVGSAPANDRKLGFAEVIAADSRYRVIRSQSADFDRARARDLMTEFLKAEGRRIRVLFAHSDTMALGGIEAIEAAGIQPGSEILVLSIEGSRKGLQAIVDGKLNVSVECSPLLGPQLMRVVTDVAAGKPVPKRVITEEMMFTRENAALEMPKRVY